MIITKEIFFEMAANLFVEVTDCFKENAYF